MPDELRIPLVVAVPSLQESKRGPKIGRGSTCLGRVIPCLERGASGVSKKYLLAKQAG